VRAPGPNDGAQRRRLPRTRRITRPDQIRALFQQGKRSRTAHLDVFDSPSPALHPRAGVVVPKHRQTVVRRNRLKRQLREIIRLKLLPRLVDANVSADLLIRARREAYDATFNGLRDELVTYVERRWRPGSSSC